MPDEDTTPRRPASDGFDRRAFLTRAGATAGLVSVGLVSFGVKPAAASPCGDSLTAAAPQPASAPEPEIDTRSPEEKAAQDSAFHPRTHTPCYGACMERRATAEFESLAAFETCMKAAGADAGRRGACSDALRAEQAQFVRVFQDCIAPC